MDFMVKFGKWVFSIIMTITGVYFLIIMQQNDDIRPIMLSILCFGVVYWIYKTRDDFPIHMAILSAVTLAATFLCTFYVPFEFQIFPFSFYLSLISWAGIFGIPAFIFVTWKFD
jgi:hypothetical protein